MKRKPKELPELVFDKKNFYDYTLEDFTLKNYDSYPAIKAKMNV